MPKRVIDFDALWASDKLAACAAWAQAEYAWLYGLADGNGSFELTNLRVIWGRVAAVRKNLSLERLEQIFEEFRANGLLFVWEENGKTYGHWTNSDLPGRLPPPSWRQRLERLAPPVPLEARAEYMKLCWRPRRSQAPGSLELASQDVAYQAAGAPRHHCHPDRSAAEGCDSELCKESLERDSSPRQTPSGLGMTVARLSPALHSCYSEPAAADEESLSETCFAALLAEPTAAQIATEEALRSPIPPLDRLGAVSKVELRTALAAAGPLANEMADPRQAGVNLKACLEAAQAQDWDLDREGNPEMNWEGEGERGNPRTIAQAHTPAPSVYADRGHSEPGQGRGELREEFVSSGCSPRTESGTQSATCAASASPAICADQVGRDSLAKPAEQGWHGTTSVAGEETASGTLALQRDSSPRQTPSGLGMTGDARRTVAGPSPAPHSSHSELRVAGGEAGKQGVTEAGKQEGTQASCPEPVGTHAPRYAYRGLRLAISERQDWLLSEAFPWVERQSEYRKMESWLEANPLRRPRNTSRFAHNWFSKIDAPTSSSATSEGLSANSSHKEFTTGGSPQGFITGGHSQVRTALSEARVGMGPQGPVRVKPEYWEKLRQREEARRTNAPKSFREVRNSDNIKT